MAVMSAPHAPETAAIVAFPSFEDQSTQVKEYWLKVHPGGEPQVSELIVAFRGLAEFAKETTVTPRQLSTIESRTLVVIGDRDPLVPVHAALEMYEAIPAAALWVTPTKGHSAMWPDWGGSAEAASILPDVLTRVLGTEPLGAPPKR